MRLITIALLLSGCASIDAIYDRSRWIYDGLEVATYTWQVESDPVRCGLHYIRDSRLLWGCAVRVRGAVQQHGARPVPGSNGAGGHCFVYSNAPEDEARRITTRHGDDLWSHELRHCRGWVHPRRKP